MRLFRATNGQKGMNPQIFREVRIEERLSVAEALLDDIRQIQARKAPYIQTIKTLIFFFILCRAKIFLVI
jgi:hypothetical protein